MTVREERTASAGLTLRHDKMPVLPEANEATRGLARQRVTVVGYPDGRSAIRHEGLDLPFRAFDEPREVAQAAVVGNERLGAAPARIRGRQDARGPARNADRRPATRDDLGRAAGTSAMPSLTGADP